MLTAVLEVIYKISITVVDMLLSHMQQDLSQDELPQEVKICMQAQQAVVRHIHFLLSAYISFA